MHASSSVKHFLRHYGEMVLAMFLGMAVLGLPVDWALRLASARTRTRSCSWGWRRR